MKLAEVIPLYKGKNCTMVTNYRPISLLVTLSKVLEKIMSTRIYKYRMNKGQLTISLFLNISKAFDTLNHNILVKKLERYGISGVARDWLIIYRIGK